MLKGARALIALVSMCARSSCQEFCLEREVNCSILLGQTFLYENQIDEICDNWEYLGLHYNQMLGNYWVYVIKVFLFKST